MRKIALFAFLLIHLNSNSQELFVFTEPASNMPAKSLGFRDMNGFFLEKDGKLNYHNMPELMWGINKEWMVHAQGFISNRQDGGFETDTLPRWRKSLKVVLIETRNTDHPIHWHNMGPEHQVKRCKQTIQKNSGATAPTTVFRF